MNRTRKRQRRRKEWNRPARLLFMGGFTLLSLWLFVLFVAKAVLPYRLGHQTDVEIARVRADIVRQKQLNNRMRAEISYLRTPEGTEREARSTGFHRKDEKVYLIPKNQMEMSSALPAPESEHRAR